MWSPIEKAQCVSWFIETSSDTQVQRKYRTRYGREPPSRPSIRSWHKSFMTTGSVLHHKGAGRPSTSEADVDRIRQVFTRSPSKSLRAAARQLQLPITTIHRVLHKRLHLYAYKVQLLQAIKPTDKSQRRDFAIEMLERIDNDHAFLHQVCFSDEATFHVSGTLNRHNVRIWGSECPHVTRELERDSPKVNVWCGLLHDRIIGPFFFCEKTINGGIYLDMLINFAVPQLEELQPTVLFQQDGAPPHWSTEVREFLDKAFPSRWMGRGGPISWPPRSPDITPLDFFMWGYVKDIVYHTKVPNITELKQRIINAISTITPDMLQRTWQEIEYRLDILRATGGAHVELYE